METFSGGMSWNGSVLSLGLGIVWCAAAPAVEPPALPDRPPGDYMGASASEHQNAPSFEQGQPLLATTYFYWYDVDTKAHIVNHDGSDAMTTHPVTLAGLSYCQPEWHASQLKDMMSAGIDIVMPVFWGVPGQYEEGHFSWSFKGIPPLVQAHDRLTADRDAQASEPPRIGLFYDTSILQHNAYTPGGGSYHVDLSTEFGREWFYTPIRDFFSLIPPEKWARIDGRPLVFLYACAFAKTKDARALDHARRRFEEDFGVSCFIIKHRDWLGAGDAQYQWGGAIALKIDPDVAALGPGYDHSAVPGRKPLVAERRGGEHYREAWQKLLSLNPARRPWLVHVETWNEWHEGTDIAESREYGRQYIDLTRRFAERWHAKEHVRLEGALTHATTVTWDPGKGSGLKPRPSTGDGIWKMMRQEGREALVSQPNDVSGARYLYFNVDSLFAYDDDNLAVDVTVTYLDRGCDAFAVEYDNTDTSKGPVSGAFRHGGRVQLSGRGGWKTATVRLQQCWFIDRCNGADFRFAVHGMPLELAVSEVTVTRVE